MASSPTKRTSPFKSDPARQKRIRQAIQDALSNNDTPPPPVITTPVTTTSRKARLEAQIRQALATPETPPSIEKSSSRPAPPLTSHSNGARKEFNLEDLGVDLSGNRPTIKRPYLVPQPPLRLSPIKDKEPPLSSAEEDNFWSALALDSPSLPSSHVEAQDSQDEIVDDLINVTPSPEEEHQLNNNVSAKAKGKQRVATEEIEEEEAFWTVRLLLF
jgi:hypothetical protein